MRISDWSSDVCSSDLLQKLRTICDKHGILLIFDEVICGFGRTGSAFGAETFGVLPDMLTTAKGLTNAAVPAAAVFPRKHVHEAFMRGDRKSTRLNFSH